MMSIRRLLAGAVLTCLAVVTAEAQNLPTGFVDETVVTGLQNPVGLGFLPGADERFLVCEKNSGRIWVCAPSGAKQLVGTVPNVRTGSERGLLGICVDPGWPTRPYAYICYSHTNPSMRIGRYTITGDVADPQSLNLSLGAFYQIISNLPDAAFNHNGGTVRFGPDGLLYASFGDDANACTAANTSDGRGVILRMDVGGLPAGAGGPASIAQLIPTAGNGHVPNPGFSPASFGPITYAYGLRNPFRFHVDPVSERLYIADVGQNAWEEYTEIIGPSETGSRNAGWPQFEGFAPYTGSCPAPNPVQPLDAVSHGQGWFSIMSFGGRYRNVPGALAGLGPSFEGDVFYHDYYSGHLRRLKFNGSSWVTPPALPGQPSAANFGTGYQNVSDAVIGKDGAIYYVRNSGSGQVRRVKGTANLPQLAVVSGDGQAGMAGTPAAAPLVVQATLPGGAPLANATVTWTITSGGGTLGQATTLTDANGQAQNTYTFDPTVFGNPVITVSLGGGSVPAEFNLTWRGLTASYFASGTAIATVRGFPPTQPWILAIDLPVAMPYLTLPSGEIWTSILSPGSTAFVLDGAGVFGLLDPGLVTSSLGIDSWFQTGLSIGGPVSFTLQAYAFDPSQTGPAAIVISNPVTLNIP